MDTKLPWSPRRDAAHDNSSLVTNAPFLEADGLTEYHTDLYRRQQNCDSLWATAAAEPPRNDVRAWEGAVQDTEKPRYFHGWRLTRRETRVVKKNLRSTGDAGAAEKLLRHSIAYGHSRLIVRRYLLALALGAPTLNFYERHFREATQELTAEELAKAEQDVLSSSAALLRVRSRAPVAEEPPRERGC